ncbi:MAG: hypothetical protein NUW06_07780 [Candidatus Acetothermia bacterium]|nr:hypothetical protein [Candidatus Acetothermia bacterium]MDH7505933.1 hypothetical protein [Candidatus Acetothermia bacterium]
MPKRAILLLLALVLPFALAGCECLWAWAELYVNRNVPAAEREFLPAKDIYICPGEAALLRWAVAERLTRARLSPGIGEVPPRGELVVSPAYTTDYTLTAEGEDCRASSTATVHVVEPGETIYLSASEIYDASTGSYYWRVEPDERLFSPNVFVNSLQAERRTDEVGPWTVTKMDPNGLVHEVIVPQDRPASPREPFSILGSWRLFPAKQYQGTATFILRVECRG